MCSGAEAEDAREATALLLAMKQLLYEAEGGKTGGGEAEAAVAKGLVRRKRGRPRQTAQATDDGDKENVDPVAETTTGKKKVELVGIEEAGD